MSSAQTQTRQNHSMKRDGGHEVPPLLVELLAIHSIQKINSYIYQENDLFSVGHAPVENHIPISIWQTVELIDLQKENDTDFGG